MELLEFVIGSARSSERLPCNSVYYISLMASEGGEVTRLLRILHSGNRGAEPQLVELLYAELRRMAAAKLRNERGGHTLTPTALVHEAYLRLAGEENNIQFRSHFLALAATAMRRVLIDHARGRGALKRGSALERIELDHMDLATPDAEDHLLALDEALERLGQLSPRQSKVVEMRYFAGLSENQIALSLGVTTRTVNRDWQMARAWLYQQLQA